MQIPPRLRAKLLQDQALDGAVVSTIAAFEVWLKSNRLAFFDEYTDHGIEHVESVLRSAGSIITDEAWEVLTSADIAVLITATLLHDCGLHLTEEGFQAITRKSDDRPVIEAMGDRPWKDLWEEFQVEASRFDGKKLLRLLGSSEPVRRISDDALEWSKRDRMLIGEFIRRHHPRLAHEIAKMGVPGPTSPGIRLIGFDAQVADLIGIVARSHGMELRAALSYLKEWHHPRSIRGARATYIMAVLRIADYLQIDSERAPQQVLQVRRVRSPASAEEWSAHQAIRHVSNAEDDPEALFVTALPEDVQTFLKLKSLFQNIQSELDTTWAVLGEVYGPMRGRELDRLGLVIRRVCSNLDDVTAFAKRVNYVPRKASLEAADADLLRLLIGPLYGERPEVGIRELVQNAVDAVRERRAYMLARLESSPASLTENTTDVDVCVYKRGTTCWVRVSDRGIGMTEDVVCNYFLRAGASYRKSDAWRSEFQPVATDAPRVLRSGRFGIGVLADFLLGDTIEVTTRHMSSPSGLKFCVSIDSDVIEIRKCDRPIGTTIRVAISAQTSAQLKGRQDSKKSRPVERSWDWYCLADPVVRRRDRRFDEAYQQSIALSGAGDPLRAGWRRLNASGFQDVQWSYSYDAPQVICDGIRVMELPVNFRYRERLLRFQKRDSMRFLDPSVAVFDPQGNLPLILSRDALAVDQLPFHDELVASVYRDFVAFVFARGPANIGSSWFYGVKYRGLEPGNGRSASWLLHRRGYGIHESATLKSLGARRILLVPKYRGHRTAIAPVLGEFDGAVPHLIRPSQSARWAAFVLQDGKTEAFETAQYFGTVRESSVVGRRVLMRPRLLDELQSMKYFKHRVGKTLNVLELNRSWSAVSVGRCEPVDDVIAELADKAGRNERDHRCSMFGEWFVRTRRSAVESKLWQVWMELLGTPLIPFDLRSREELLRRRSAEFISAVEQHRAEFRRKPRVRH